MREVTIKIGLERLDTQEGITVEALLDSGATGLVMSSEFAKKKGFKLKKLDNSACHPHFSHILAFPTLSS